MDCHCDTYKEILVKQLKARKLLLKYEQVRRANQRAARLNKALRVPGHSA